MVVEVVNPHIEKKRYTLTCNTDMKKQLDKNKKAKKSLGQHFLTSTYALDQIVKAGDITSSDLVVEIGPGKGVLTERLITSAGKVIAIEKDRELIAGLRESFSRAIDGFRFELIEGDILDFDTETLRGSKKTISYKVIANIPYYITNAIIRLFLEATSQPERMVLLIQKEVADRIMARDGKESILSIAVKAYGTPKVVAKVPPGAFNPPPKVDSAVIVISSISKKLFQMSAHPNKEGDASINEKTFFKIVRAGFAHKRKMLAGNLTTLYKKDAIAIVFKKIGMPMKTRAEDITIQDWKKLAEEFSK